MTRKSNRKAVSAIIGVILMVAITVSISATVYVYISNLTSSQAEAMPSIAISKISDTKLIVIKAESDLIWNKTVIVVVEGNASNLTIPSDPIVKPGQVIKIGNDIESITITCRNFVVGTWAFNE